MVLYKITESGVVQRMGLKRITADEAERTIFSCLENAAVDEQFYSVETKNGNAVIISETEWNIMCDALGMVLNAK